MKNPEVNAFMLKLDNPLKAEMEAVRNIILNASKKISEDIKWSAPNFFYKENLATFNPKAKKYVTLLFHKGALIKDKSGLLEGEGRLTRTARFYDMDDVKSKKKNLGLIVKEWIKMMDKLK
ncbi:MAG TPA: DUF1801 domain-containing protein [Chitinophagaceae bacterium]|nr:DUF1801 domain-containing protein [Chitinophagaceae bacterium]